MIFLLYCHQLEIHYFREKSSKVLVYYLLSEDAWRKTCFKCNREDIRSLAKVAIPKQLWEHGEQCNITQK